MRYTLTLLEQHLAELREAFANPDGHERAAYLLCSTSVTPSETRLIVSRIELIRAEHVISSSPNHVSIQSQSFVLAIAKADRDGRSFFFVHSHGAKPGRFSRRDDREERALFRTAYIRAPKGPHGSLIIAGSEAPDLVGRVWLDEKRHMPVSRIRVVGRRLRIFDRARKDTGATVPPWADRQVRAFGSEVQELLGRLHIGVVGTGGTGSSVSEQLIRMGVGKLTVIDEQVLADTNVTRLYGSRLSDTGRPKAELIKRLARGIGLGTRVTAIQGSVCDRATAELLRDCDLVFGCTDDFLGRMILNRIAIWYYIPVIDMAVAIDSKEGRIREITGRVTILAPGNACLACRGRVSSDRLRAQGVKRANPTEYAEQVEEGYAPELDEPDPAVIMFTTGIAARAVAEFVHMLTGYMGDDRVTTETLERFHETEVRRNSSKGSASCICTDEARWGRGDQRDFIGRKW